MVSPGQIKLSFPESTVIVEGMLGCPGPTIISKVLNSLSQQSLIAFTERVLAEVEAEPVVIFIEFVLLDPVQPFGNVQI